MKKFAMAIIMGGLLLIVAAPACAQALERQSITMPFDFYIGNQQFAAGQYWIELRAVLPLAPQHSSFVVHRADGSIIAILSTIPGSDVKADGHLHFANYGGKSFLARIETRGRSASLKPASIQKELMAQNGVLQDRVVTSN